MNKHTNFLQSIPPESDRDTLPEVITWLDKYPGRATLSSDIKADIIREEQKAITPTVSFQEHEIPIFKQDGVSYVPMKPFIETIGMNWSEKLSSLKKSWQFYEEVYGLTKQKSFICIPLYHLTGWLSTCIHPKMPLLIFSTKRIRLKLF